MPALVELTLNRRYAPEERFEDALAEIEEVVRRIIRQNFGRFRLCYENGLRRNPNLQGRVSVRFVIGADGAVSNVGNGGSDMPDGGVVSCIMRSFEGLSFPRPEGGIVTVVYPIMFSPGG